jgi:hypothetical protein
VAKEDNLTPFKPGESGNPKGRPPGKSFKTILNELLDLKASDNDLSDDEIKNIFSDSKEPITNREILMAKLLLKAKKDADSKSMQRLLDRVEGTPKQTVETTILGELAITGMKIIPIENKDVTNL